MSAAIGEEITRASADYVDVLIAQLAGNVAPVAEEPAPPSGLTPREHQVLRLIAEARSNAEIAEELSITEGTVKRHAGAIYDKLGARSRLDAVRKATKLRIL